jgi:anthraniloyl-CoA monooxygenase
VEVATAKFIWFGTTYQFDGLTFVHAKGPHGTFAVHGYPIGDGLSTFIVETDEDTWRAAGLDEFDTSRPPGVSDEKSRQYLEKLFAEQIEGCELVTNNSRWGNFRTLRTRSWHTGNTVILGDAAHTAHFSVGSGTKMAMEDGIALAAALVEHIDDLPAALDAYEAARRPSVERIQNAARPSLSWWEHFGRYYDAFEPTQFAFHFLSRSIGREKLARRDPGFVAEVERDWRARHGADPITTPLTIGDRTLPGRLLTLDELPDKAIRLSAPDTEADLPEAYQHLEDVVAGHPPLVAVHAGTSLTRRLLAERTRLDHGVPVLVAEPGATADDAVTLVLSGRADLVSVT